MSDDLSNNKSNWFIFFQLYCECAWAVEMNDEDDDGRELR